MRYLLALSAEDIENRISGPFEGVGLIRGEYICRKDEVYVTTSHWKDLTWKYLTRIANIYQGSQVWYRFSELECQEVNVLKGVDHQIDGETNPALGLRGIRRSRRYPETFRQEAELLVELSKSHSNLNLILPYVADESDVNFAREILLGLGFRNSLGMMVETPAAVLRLPQCFAAGVSFALVGMNDLSSLTLGRERGSADINFSHPALIQMLQFVVAATKAANAACAVAGYYDADFLKAAESWGVDYAVLHYSMLDKYLGPDFSGLAGQTDLWAIKKKTREAIADRRVRMTRATEIG